MLTDLQHLKRTVSRDKRVYVYIGLAIRIIINLLLTELVIGLLMVLIIVIYAVKVTLRKILGILAALGLFVMVLLSIMLLRRTGMPGAVMVLVNTREYDNKILQNISSSKRSTSSISYITKY